MRLLSAVAAAVCLAVPAAPAQARAHPSVPPRLTVSAGVQAGNPVYATFRSRAGAYCNAWHADYPGKFPGYVRHDGSPLSWRIDNPLRPDQVVVYLFRAGTDDVGLGQAERLTMKLTPLRSRGRLVAWQATSPPVGYGDLHVDVTVVWPAGPCGSDDGRYRYRALSLPFDS